MDTTRSRVDTFLPVKPVIYHILLALAERDAHGYGVIQAVQRQSSGQIKLPTGAFYRHLRRLLDDGLVVEAGPAPPGDDPRRGSYYRLTDTGRKVVQAEWRRMADLVAASRKLATSAHGEPA